MLPDGFLPGHPLREYTVSVKDRKISLLGVRDPFRLLDEPFVKEGFERDERMPYWADMWPSSISLAECIFEMRERGELPPPRAPEGEWDALELGCGVGLAGIAAAMNGYRVLCTDQEERALTLTGENARRNGVGHLVGTSLLDWRDDPPGRFALVLASDCTYEQRNVRPLVLCIRKALMPASAVPEEASGEERGHGSPGVALLADPDRFSARSLRWIAGEAGFTVSVQERQLAMPVHADSAPWLGPKGLDGAERTHVRMTVNIYSLKTT